MLKKLSVFSKLAAACDLPVQMSAVSFGGQLASA